MAEHFSHLVTEFEAEKARTEILKTQLMNENNKLEDLLIQASNQLSKLRERADDREAKEEAMADEI